MPMIKCRCGKYEQRYQHNIGDWFLGECCKKAGYDQKGNLAVKAEVAAVVSEDSKPKKTSKKK
jgi:hypothetical protein